uniref:ACT domain-containing protein n=1 Tax=Compsopogon caeruleus TaxID=31354 RepID=A0A7S1XGI2_9RHOD|mmetsp:Transcript_5985/g.11780  ORF Transcript_5985/g.11780 Transcript_5985/m.11780 type:complete len:323 (+) Transcript_5985:45-1013(+)
MKIGFIGMGGWGNHWRDGVRTVVCSSKVQEGVVKEATLLVSCPDRKGVVAALGQLLYGHGCNIVESDQVTLHEEQQYFQRISFHYDQMHVGPANVDVLERAVEELGAAYDMKWQVAYADRKKRVALMVTRADHCLWDLLIRHRAGELNCEIPVVISNRTDLVGTAEVFGVEFVHIPVDEATMEAKLKMEEQLESLLLKYQIDTIVLARYMQVLSPAFCEKHRSHCINIHHSFLPAFEGARPYHQASARGVKIIGATAHYVTAELDSGPIIEQDVARISHRDSVADMIRKGKDLERLVLARAVRWHLENRVLIHGNKTVVFPD